MQPPSYSEAIMPKSWRACGIWLKPMTLGHAILLDRVGNPCSRPIGDVPLLRGTVVAAAYICSRSWQAAAAGVDSRWAGFWMFRRHHATAVRAQRDLATLREYTAAAWPEFDFWSEPDQDGRADGVTFEELQTLVTLQRVHFGLSLDAALSIPVAIAVHDHYCVAHCKGNLRLFDRTDYLLTADADQRERAFHA